MSDDSYKTLATPAEGFFRDRNSRFLAFGYPVFTVEQINNVLGNLQKKYHDARHHCYAYVLGYNKETSRMNDDGEPSGTAGRPIFNQIASHDLTNTMVVVVRYFGGTLLGTGGLINAYRSATANMIENANIITNYVLTSHRLRFRYEQLGAVMRMLKDENLIPVNPVYEADCQMEIHLRTTQSERLVNKLVTVPDLIIETLQSNDESH